MREGVCTLEPRVGPLPLSALLWELHCFVRCQQPCQSASSKKHAGTPAEVQQNYHQPASLDSTSAGQWWFGPTSRGCAGRIEEWSTLTVPDSARSCIMSYARHLFFFSRVLNASSIPPSSFSVQLPLLYHPADRWTMLQFSWYSRSIIKRWTDIMERETGIRVK